MILSLFTLRRAGHGHFHQIFRTHEGEDVNRLILLGKAWEEGGNGQHYEITEGVAMATRREIVDPRPIVRVCAA